VESLTCPGREKRKGSHPGYGMVDYLTCKKRKTGEAELQAHIDLVLRGMSSRDRFNLCGEG
jgi:hypothetical protein